MTSLANPSPDKAETAAAVSAKTGIPANPIPIVIPVPTGIQNPLSNTPHAPRPPIPNSYPPPLTNHPKHPPKSLTLAPCAAAAHPFTMSPGYINITADLTAVRG